MITKCGGESQIEIAKFKTNLAGAMQPQMREEEIREAFRNFDR
jgi:Ca2+-binding EF-hand superfamily protein